MGRLRTRRRQRAEELLLPLLRQEPAAEQGWLHAAPRTRDLYLQYIGSPWTKRMRQLLAQNTAIWAAAGELELHVRRSRLRDDDLPPLDWARHVKTIVLPALDSRAARETPSGTPATAR